MAHRRREVTLEIWQGVRAGGRGRGLRRFGRSVFRRLRWSAGPSRALRLVLRGGGRVLLDPQDDTVVVPPEDISQVFDAVLLAELLLQTFLGDAMFTGDGPEALALGVGDDFRLLLRGSPARVINGLDALRLETRRHQHFGARIANAREPSDAIGDPVREGRLANVALSDVPARDEELIPRVTVSGEPPMTFQEATVHDPFDFILVEFPLCILALMPNYDGTVPRNP